MITDFELSIAPGELVAWWFERGRKDHARTGAGRKPGPRAGTVLLDASAAPKLGHSTLLVSQEVHVFSGTIAENLLLAAPASTTEELTRAVLEAEAHWVLALPEGLDTVVGHGALHLTGEQTQHLALVRALLNKAGMVVLDEATAEAGSASAALMERVAMRITRGRTGVVVAHRLSQAAQADASWSWKTGGSSSRAATRNCSHRPAPTPPCGRPGAPPRLGRLTPSLAFWIFFCSTVQD